MEQPYRLIQKMLDSYDENGFVQVVLSGAGAGDASAANQLTEIARLDSILAKIIAAPATAAGQASILAKITAAAATEATAAAILAKIIASPATEAKQDAAITQLTSIATRVLQLNDYIASGKTIDDCEVIKVARSGAGDVELKADQGSKHVLLMSLYLTCDADGTTLELEEKDGDPQYSGPTEFDDKQGIVLPNTGFRHARSASGKGMQLSFKNGGANGSATILVVDE